MKRIVIIEDDENKLSNVLTLLKSEFPDIILAEARSLKAGINLLTSDKCDVVILDMTLPLFDRESVGRGAKIRSFGGRDVLRQMDREENRTPVIVLTQFESFTEQFEVKGLTELDHELRAEHDQYQGLIYYHASLERWKVDLKDKLADLLFSDSQ